MPGHIYGRPSSGLPLPSTHYYDKYCLLRPEQLINLIVNRDYWEIIDVQTIIVMSIRYILSKEISSETRLCKSICCQIQCVNCHKPEYRYMIC